jgi:hypothetical protein
VSIHHCSRVDCRNYCQELSCAGIYRPPFICSLAPNLGRRGFRSRFYTHNNISCVILGRNKEEKRRRKEGKKERKEKEEIQRKESERKRKEKGEKRKKEREVKAKTDREIYPLVCFLSISYLLWHSDREVRAGRW